MQSTLFGVHPLDGGNFRFFAFFPLKITTNADTREAQYAENVNALRACRNA